MAWEGREPLRDWIYLSISLCFCVPDSTLSPFLIFSEIRNSDRAEILTRFLSDIRFLAAKEGHQPPYGVATRVQGAPDPLGRAPLPRGPLGHCIALILLPKNHKYSRKILRQFLSRLDSI